MFDFNSIQEISLSIGSHSTRDEGLCFMEMVSWFAGEEHSDQPACACPVLTGYGIGLNDRMPDDVRNKLLKPLIPLMVGTRNGSLETKRMEILAMNVINNILPLVVSSSKLADACKNATTLAEGENAAYAAANAAYAAYAYAAANAAAYANANAAANAAAANAAAANAVNAAANAAANAVNAAANAAANADKFVIWEIAVEGLRRAIDYREPEQHTENVENLEREIA
jgi:hypothetical protein